MWITPYIKYAYIYHVKLGWETHDNIHAFIQPTDLHSLLPVMPRIRHFSVYLNLFYLAFSKPCISVSSLETPLNQRKSESTHTLSYMHIQGSPLRLPTWGQKWRNPGVSSAGCHLCLLGFPHFSHVSFQSWKASLPFEGKHLLPFPVGCGRGSSGNQQTGD